MDVVLLLLAACAIPPGFNIRACVLIHRDDLSERSQKLFQLLLVWLVPLFGAIIVLWVHRADEEPSGT
ncbi:hypothetical protein [Uliginosibacterium sp. H1]|uniref:hypothetical protein n=1 Tax=Uliginosibacterium sp. H1 TaxID=3114757 RepID=UPI002E193DF0|nr:hypothetical protein [Uliginosibacterium sp. H1]